MQLIRHFMADDARRAACRLGTCSRALSPTRRFSAWALPPLPEDAALFDPQPYDGGDDYRLFTLGGALDAVPAQGLYFPELSHA